MRLNRTTSLFLLGALLALPVGCSTEGATETETPGGSANITQGGAQDFAEFRSIVEAGGVPSPDVLDPVGFFAEHALDMPAADCGKDICVHPFLAVAPKFNEDNWTMAYVTMNTPVDPKDLPHKPMHLVIAVEAGMFDGTVYSPVTSAVTSMLANLGPDDRVSVLSFGDHTKSLVEDVGPSDPDLPAMVESALEEIGDGTTDLYGGIATADEMLTLGDEAGFVGQHRVLLLTGGHATSGITDPEHILSLAEDIVKKGTAFSVIGAGEKFDATLPSALGSMGAGTYAYAQSMTDLASLLIDEGETALYPLATDLTLEITPAKGYSVGRIYGVHRAAASADGVTLSLPAVFIGQRKGASDVGGSRRGGGGALFVELRGDANSGVGANAPAFQVTADWTSANGGIPQNLVAPMNNTLPPGQNPPDMWWTISDGGDGKPFMMLNMYLALRATVDFYQAGDCARSLGVVDMMQQSVGGWLGKYQDTDITDDNNVLLSLRKNVENACAAQASAVTPVEPTSFDGGCCLF
ncbi:MAG: hypothetical protein U0441_26590 [Polyangiaceae bacterium]